MSKEQRLLDEIAKIHDAQTPWVMLSQSAVPRANHILRTLPPSQSADYAGRHDAATWQTFCDMLGATELAHDELANNVATLPGWQGGLGLRAASRSAPTAFWASFVDSLPVIAQKVPDLLHCRPCWPLSL